MQIKNAAEDILRKVKVQNRSFDPNAIAQPLGRTKRSSSPLTVDVSERIKQVSEPSAGSVRRKYQRLRENQAGKRSKNF